MMSAGVLPILGHLSNGPRRGGQRFGVIGSSYCTTSLSQLIVSNGRHPNADIPPIRTPDRFTSAARPPCSLTCTPVDDRFALLEAAEHAPENLIVLAADAHRFDHLGFKIRQEFARDDNLADEAHANAPGFGLDDNDTLAFDQFTIALAGSATFSLFAEHDDTVDVALVLARGAIPFDGRELLNQQALALIHRAPVPARHRGLVFAHLITLEMGFKA